MCIYILKSNHFILLKKEGDDKFSERQKRRPQRYVLIGKTMLLEQYQHVLQPQEYYQKNQMQNQKDLLLDSKLMEMNTIEDSGITIVKLVDQLTMDKLKKLV